MKYRFDFLSNPVYNIDEKKRNEETINEMEPTRTL